MALTYESSVGIAFAFGVILIGGFFLILYAFKLHEKYRDIKSVPKPDLTFNFIVGDRIVDSNDFDIIAYAKETGGGMEWVTFYGEYILKHKTTGKYYRYKYDLEYPDTTPKSNLQEISKPYAMYQYQEFMTREYLYSLQHYNKTYEEAFDIKLKPLGEEMPVKIVKPEPIQNIDDPNFLEIV